MVVAQGIIFVPNVTKVFKGTFSISVLVVCIFSLIIVAVTDDVDADANDDAKTEEGKDSFEYSICGCTDCCCVGDRSESSAVVSVPIDD